MNSDFRDTPDGLTLVKSGEVIRAAGTFVWFDDGVVAQCATAGVWHRNLGHDELDPTRSMSADLRVVGSALFSAGSRHWSIAALNPEEVATTLDRMIDEHHRHYEPGSGRPEVLTIEPALLPGRPPVVHLRHPGDPSSKRRSTIDSAAVELGGRAPSAVVLTPASVYGTRVLGPEVVRAVIDRYVSDRTLLVADEVVAGFFRTGPAFAHEEWSRPPDVVVLGPAASNGQLPVHLVATRAESTTAALSGLHLDRSETATITSVADRTDLMRLRDAVAENSLLLARGIRAMVDSGIFEEVSGRGFGYAVRPAAQPVDIDLLERLRRDELWLAADETGMLLVTPAVVCDAADLARIFDSLHAVLGPPGSTSPGGPNGPVDPAV